MKYVEAPRWRHEEESEKMRIPRRVLRSKCKDARCWRLCELWDFSHPCFLRKLGVFVPSQESRELPSFGNFKPLVTSSFRGGRLPTASHARAKTVGGCQHGSQGAKGTGCWRIGGKGLSAFHRTAKSQSWRLPTANQSSGEGSTDNIYSLLTLPPDTVFYSFSFSNLQFGAST